MWQFMTVEGKLTPQQHPHTAAGAGRAWHFQCAGALAVWLLPGLTPYQRTLVGNLLAGFVVDVMVVGTIKGIVRRG